MKEDNYPFADRRTPMNRYLINFGLGTGIALIIGLQRCYEFITYKYEVTKPTLVSFISCAALFLIFAPILIWRHGFSGLSYIYKTRSWLYLIFALLEIQGSYMYNFAIEKSSIYVFIIYGTIGIFTLLFSKFILNTRYKLFHLIGSLLCFLGVLFICISEYNFSLDKELAKAIKCIFCAFACVPLYSLSYVSLEAALRQFSIEEVLTFYGLYGMIINALTM
jgi:solute carrier family 35 protein F1/2